MEVGGGSSGEDAISMPTQTIYCWLCNLNTREWSSWGLKLDIVNYQYFNKQTKTKNNNNKKCYLIARSAICCSSKCIYKQLELLMKLRIELDNIIQSLWLIGWLVDGDVTTSILKFWNWMFYSVYISIKYTTTGDE